MNWSRNYLLFLLLNIGTFSSWAFIVVPNHNNHQSSFSTTLLMANTVSPGDEGTVGVIGRGFVSVLTAKLLALKGYDTWMIIPPGAEETTKILMGDISGKKLELVQAADSETIQSRAASMSALIIAIDDTNAIDASVVEYLLQTDNAKNVQRIVGMSRNLNGQNMGFFVKASKATANANVWDGSTLEQFRAYETLLKQKAADLGADYTIVRAGTLKGGACGEKDQFPQFLTTDFYEMTKRDVVNFNLLFDCNIRGVTLAKGDVMKGPGNKAIFTATSNEACDGDTSRCGVAEAMVRSLALEQTANVDFGVGTAASREPPADVEWDQLFSIL